MLYKPVYIQCTLHTDTGDLSAQLSRELDEVEPSPIPEERPCYLPALMGCRNVEENYDYLNKIEEGTYGVVHRAKDKQTGEGRCMVSLNVHLMSKIKIFRPSAGKIFALKRLKLENEKEGFPITSLREIDMLLKAKHPNIVGVRVSLLSLPPSPSFIWDTMIYYSIYRR